MAINTKLMIAILFLLAHTYRTLTPHTHTQSRDDSSCQLAPPRPTATKLVQTASLPHLNRQFANLLHGVFASCFLTKWVDLLALSCTIYDLLIYWVLFYSKNQNLILLTKSQKGREFSNLGNGDQEKSKKKICD